MHMPITSNTDLIRPQPPHCHEMVGHNSRNLPDRSIHTRNFVYKVQPGAATAATQRVVSLGRAGIMLVRSGMIQGWTQD